MGTASSVEEFKQITSFQSLRKSLLQEDFAERLEKPLAYWAMPAIGALPLAFLGRTLRELLDTPFEQLAATPGIGRKKISIDAEAARPGGPPSAFERWRDREPIVLTKSNQFLVEVAIERHSMLRPFPRQCGTSGAKPCVAMAWGTSRWAV